MTDFLPCLRALAVSLLVLVAGACRSAEPRAAEAVDAGARATAEEIGSTRGAVVALPMATPRPLTYLAGSMDAELLAECARVAPNVRFVTGLDRESALAHAAEAHAADAYLVSPQLLAAAPELHWAQSPSAGVERYLAIEELATSERIVLTNMKGVHGPAIADHVFAMVLALTRDLDAFRAAQREGRWARGAGEDMISLAGRTLLVCGLGGIGSEVAKRAQGFDMHVVGTVRTPRTAPPYVDRLALGTELDELLPEADVVVICLPLTEETDGLFGRARLAALPDDAILVNIGRGRIVDTDALVEALEADELGAAGLDVTEPEPLPEGHPLWAREDVVITPHVASRAAVTGERRRAVFVENVRRFAHGEPLLNVVDKAAGY